MIVDFVKPEEWYTVQDVAELLGFGRDTVIRQIKQGYLKAFVMPCKSTRRCRVFESRRIQRAEILRYVRERMR